MPPPPASPQLCHSLPRKRMWLFMQSLGRALGRCRPGSEIRFISAMCHLGWSQGEFDLPPDGWQYQASGASEAKQTAAFLNSRDAGGDIGLMREQLSWAEDLGACRTWRKLSPVLQHCGLTESGSGVAWNESHHCRLLAGLVPDQFQLCRRNLEVMHSIVRAARQTKSVCQKTFADMRWNCSSIQRAPSFGPDLLKGTRESAFVYALAAAAVSHSIAQACTSGELPLCSCGSIPSEVPGPDFRWGGCGDNLRYGLQLGTAFADSPLKSSKLGTQGLKAMNLHNNAAGRQVLSDSLDTKCKCHGVSGSCSVKTCWKGLPNLDEIASDLKSKYLAAIRVTHRLIGPRKQLIPKEMDVRPVKEMDLVYLINSPDYCMPNQQLGSLGTQDRQCNKTSVSSDSCNLMCCGRGYNTYTEEVVERCHCKYHWCCYVVCKKCRRKVERYVCK